MKMVIIVLFGKFQDWGYDPILFYTPVIEQESDEERFLTESPMKTLLDGKFMNIPWMTGMNKDEFIYRALS
jgi:hypothetical protein